MGKSDFHYCGQGLIGIIIIIVMIGLVSGALYYYLSRQIPKLLEIFQKLTKEMTKPKEEKPTEKVKPEVICQNECSLTGLKRCLGNGYQICGNYDADACLEWSSVTYCSSNTTCQDGICIQQKCADGTLYDHCSINKPKYCEDGNLVDKASFCGCPSGYTISDNQCLIKIPAQDFSICNLNPGIGSKMEAGIRTVQFDACQSNELDYSLNWSFSGAGSDSGATTIEAPRMSRTLNLNSGILTLTISGKGYTHSVSWEVNEATYSYTISVSGLVGDSTRLYRDGSDVSCLSTDWTDGCDPSNTWSGLRGSHIASIQSSVTTQEGKICTVQGSNSVNFSSQGSYDFFYSCTICQNECSLTGLKRCLGNGYQICGNYDADACLEWSSVTYCSSNTTCQDGICIQQKCADGTLYDHCSINKPKYCEDGNLVDKASFCGCPSGYTISDNQCLPETIPATWQEHWFEHNQLVNLKYYDSNVAVYFDDDMNEIEASWQYSYISQITDYVKKAYGNIYSDRLYAIYHQGKYYGGHPSYYYDSSHDYRNVIDCGRDDWHETDNWAKDGPSHEVSHVVESTIHGKKGSPAIGIWGDSKWAEFFQYDLYLGIGRESDAQRVYNQFINTIDNFPRANTHWFRDWFYPIWQNYGEVAVMKNFFSLIGQYWPTDSSGYTRDMNWGEFVHFMSGAARNDLRNLASNAFGWPTEWESQFQKARIDFPEVTELY